MQQFRLSLGHDKDSLRAFLEKAIQKPVELVVTDNVTSMISCRWTGETVSLRLHHMFLTAGHDVLDELVLYIRRGKRKTPHIRAFIDDNGHLIQRRTKRSVMLKPGGRYHDLRALFEEINNEYFDERISAGITWGSKGSRRRARTRTLGCYVSDDNIIRINPILDSRRVPRYFVAFVVYHEMLHADMGFGRKQRRRTVHSKEFKRRERLFRYYDRAMKWEL